MTRKLVDVIAGARPNFMKIAPILKALATYSDEIECRLVHTGQHYDASMSGAFFDQLGIPEPSLNLEVGSGSQATQTGQIMVRYEEALKSRKSDLCIVVGDVNSTIACALTAQKCGVKVAHVEAGIRSRDWSMPEEINRLATDAITSFFFTTSHAANANLAADGVPEDRIYFVGNTMIDTLISNLSKLKPPTFWDELMLKTGNYFLLTLHRPSNVDNVEYFEKLLMQLCTYAEESLVVFPAHPRNSAALGSALALPENLKVVEPQPYHEFIFMLKNAIAIITDSGGITEEATVLNVPCITMRDSTERPETVEIGTNVLVGNDLELLKTELCNVKSGKGKTGSIPELWDGKTGERIAKIIRKIVLNEI